jgi:hypothetical protein
LELDAIQKKYLFWIKKFGKKYMETNEMQEQEKKMQKQ